MSEKRAKEFAVYKGEDIIAMGTVEEIAEQLNVKVNTIKCYITPKGQEKLSKFKNGRVFVPIHYDEDEDEYYGENGRRQRETKERSH